jgi:hypothetical protein
VIISTLIVRKYELTQESSLIEFHVATQGRITTRDTPPFLLNYYT